MLNYLFLIIYVLGSVAISGETMYYVLATHCFLLAVSHLGRKRPIDPIFLFYIGVMLAAFANVRVISKVGTPDYKLYSYLISAYVDQAAQLWCISVTMVIIGYGLLNKRGMPAIVLEKKTQHLKKLF